MKYIRSFVIGIILAMIISLPLMIFMQIKWSFNIFLIEDWKYKTWQMQKGIFNDPWFINSFIIAGISWFVLWVIASYFFEKKVKKEIQEKEEINSFSNVTINERNQMKEDAFEAFKPIKLEIGAQCEIPHPTQGEHPAYAKKEAPEKQAEKTVITTAAEEKKETNKHDVANLQREILNSHIEKKQAIENKEKEFDKFKVPGIKDIEKIKDNFDLEQNNNTNIDTNEQKTKEVIMDTKKIKEQVKNLFKQKGYEIKQPLKVEKFENDFIAIADKLIINVKIFNNAGEIITKDSEEKSAKTNWINDLERITSPIYEMENIIEEIDELSKEVLPDNNSIKIEHFLIITNSEIKNLNEVKKVWEEKNIQVMRFLNGGPETLTDLNSELIDMTDLPPTDTFKDFVNLMIEYFEEEERIKKLKDEAA